MSNWLASTLQNVREKSLDALEFVRRDLTEFTSTVKADTESYLNRIKPPEVTDLGLNQFVSKWTKPDKTEEHEEKNLHASASFDRMQSELSRLQNDESTYLTDPNPLEPYENWRRTTEFNVETRKGEIAQLLIDAPHVRALYATFVPAQTTHMDFWSRYFYRIHQLELEEERRTQFIKRAYEICSVKNEDDPAGVSNDWDEPDDESSINRFTPIVDESTITKNIEPQSEKMTPAELVMENPLVELKETDSGSGDSWEHEFEESDSSSTKVISEHSFTPVPKDHVDEITTNQSENPSNTDQPTTSIPMEGKKENELDDDWESWS